VVPGFAPPPGLENVVPAPDPPPGLESMLPGATLPAVEEACRLDQLPDKGSPAKIQIGSLHCVGKDHTSTLCRDKVRAKENRCLQPHPGLQLQHAAYVHSAQRVVGSNHLPGVQPPGVSGPTFPPGVFSPTHLCPAKEKNSTPKFEKHSCKSKATGTKEETDNSCGGGTLADHRLISLLLQCNTPLFQLLPCLIAVAKDRAGSQFLRAQLPEAANVVQAMVVDTALQEVIPLSMHQYGHSLILQVLDLGTAEQKEVLAQCLSSHAKTLAQDIHGCRVIQKALKVMPLELCERIMGGLKECIIQCMQDFHGNHVVQVCIEVMPTASIDFIIEAVEAYGAAQLATHTYAFHVLMRLLKHVQWQQLQNVMHQILSSVGKLAQDSHGNNVLQHIMENGNMADRRKLMSQVVQCGVASLARQRDANHVIKKCIEVSWRFECEMSLEKERLALARDLLWGAGVSPVAMLASDRFGATVVECMLDNLTGSLLDDLKLLLHKGEASFREACSDTAILTSSSCSSSSSSSPKNVKPRFGSTGICLPVTMPCWDVTL